MEKFMSDCKSTVWKIPCQRFIFNKCIAFLTATNDFTNGDKRKTCASRQGDRGLRAVFVCVVSLSGYEEISHFQSQSA